MQIPSAGLRAEGGDLFSFPTITTNFNDKHPISGDQPHRVDLRLRKDFPQFAGPGSV